MTLKNPEPVKRHILVATDGSESANMAIDEAARLAAALGCGLSIVHVLLHGRPAEEYRRMAEIENLMADMDPVPFADFGPRPLQVGDFMDQLRRNAETSRVASVLGETILEHASARACDAGVRKVETRICYGDYADEILDLAEVEPPEMIVLGSRGLGRVRGALLGSVSQKVLHHARCPVLIVRQPELSAINADQPVTLHPDVVAS